MRHQPGDGKFELFYGLFGLTIVAVWTLWVRHYSRIWVDYRSRGWQRVAGRFDDGEVVTMRKARSKTIAGYEVWLGYDYQAEGEQAGLYRLPRKSKEDAETALSRLANQHMTVRVAPRNPKRSHVSEDLAALLRD
jgi:hypothetical protein